MRGVVAFTLLAAMFATLMSPNEAEAGRFFGRSGCCDGPSCFNSCNGPMCAAPQYQTAQFAPAPPQQYQRDYVVKRNDGQLEQRKEVAQLFQRRRNERPSQEPVRGVIVVRAKQMPAHPIYVECPEISHPIEIEDVPELGPDHPIVIEPPASAVDDDAVIDNSLPVDAEAGQLPAEVEKDLRAQVKTAVAKIGRGKLTAKAVKIAVRTTIALVVTKAVQDKVKASKPQPK